MKELFKELGRRNVIRVAVFYLVLSWVILQVADVVFGFLKVPDWAGTLVLVLLALGLPLVLGFAWAFEITPEGIKRESEVDRDKSITSHTGRKLDVLTIAVGGAAIILIAAQAFIPGFKHAPATGSGVADDAASSASIAVLPFVDMSAGKDQEYLSDGISEELLNLLAKLPELRVISRTSSFQFKGKSEDVRTIGNKLGVAHVLEGSVRKAENTVRITAQLVKTEDGSHVWSETYDRTLDDIFKVQDDIASEVVRALQIKLLNRAQLSRSIAVNPEAHNLLLLARYHRQRHTPEDYAKAEGYLRQAIAIDSTYAEAWSERARVYASRANFAEEASSLVAQARRAAQRAVQLDANLADGHLVRAEIASVFEWDWDAAAENLGKAEALTPTNYDVMNAKATLAMRRGEFEQAIDLFRAVITRDPVRFQGYANLALLMTAVDSLRTAEALVRKALDINPRASALNTLLALTLLYQEKREEALAAALQETQDGFRLWMLAAVYHSLGHTSQSDAALDSLKTRFAEVAPYQIAEAYAYRGQAGEAFAWLERAYQHRDPGIASMKRSVMLKPLRRDPRFAAILRKLKLPES